MLSLIEVEDHPSFYHIPNFDTLAISRDGKVIDLVREKELEYVIRPDGYLRVKTIGYGELHVHRLLGLTFIDCPGNPEDFYINHKDGVKLNLDISNLEWSTPSENSIHAYKTGLRSDNRPIVSMDLITGKETYFYSLQEAARYFSRNPSVLYHYLNGKRKNAFQRKYVLKYKDGSWPDLSSVVIDPQGPGFMRDVVAENQENGNCIIFDSVSSAAEHFGLKQATVRKRLNTGNEKEFSGWIFYYLKNYDKDLTNALEIKTPKQIKPVNLKRKPVEIKVTNLLDGTSEFWPSVEALAISVGAKKNTIQKAVLVNSGSWRNLKIEYLRNTQSPLIQ